MATLYGGAMPDDFVSGEELTATEFNKVKNYWIVDGDLPEGPEILDGDVVFVLGDTVGTPEAEITATQGPRRSKTCRSVGNSLHTMELRHQKPAIHSLAHGAHKSMAQVLRRQ